MISIIPHSYIEHTRHSDKRKHKSFRVPDIYIYRLCRDNLGLSDSNRAIIKDLFNERDPLSRVFRGA